MSNRPSSPLWVTVNVTSACNLSCRYCFNQPRSHEHMPLEDFQTLLGILKQAQIFLLTLSGGEPFLHPDIDQILRLVHSKFDHATVLSNGTRITRKNLETIREIIEQKGYFPVQVSLDAKDPLTNELTRGKTENVLKNLEALREAGASITIAIVVSSQNIDHIIDSVLELKDITRHFHVMPIKRVPFLEGADQYLSVDRMRMSDFWKALSELRDAHDLMLRTPHDDCFHAKTCASGAPCMAGFTQVVVDPNLNVRACDRCIHAVVGNLKQEKMSQIWNGPRLAHVYQREVPLCESSEEWDAWTAGRQDH